MADDLSRGMRDAEARAEAITKAQIEAALQMNAVYFKDTGLEHIGPILQALAQNYTAQLLAANMPAA